jgi:hypothetical protein
MMFHEQVWPGWSVHFIIAPTILTSLAPCSIIEEQKSATMHDRSEHERAVATAW